MTRQKWMAAFEDGVIALAPQHRGKIEWASATFMFNQGMTPTDAATRYVANRR